MLKQAILCVDDEAMILEGLKEQLKRDLGSDYRIEVAESGEEALKILDELTREKIDVPIIISDHIMPGMNGEELLSQVHARFPQTLKVFLTGRADAGAIANAVNSANLYRYISKPWDAEDLRLTVTEGLRSYLQERVLKKQRENLKKLYDQAKNEIAERKQAEQRLENQYQFERLISELSARFVNIPTEQVDGEIENALRQILAFFQVDRCGLIRVSDNDGAHLTHICYAEGVPRVPEAIKYNEYYPWHAEKILSGETVHLHVKDLPPEAAIDRQSFEQMGIRANLTIPLMVGGSVDYVVVINAVRNERLWTEEQISRMRLLGEIFVNALVRKRAEEELKRSYHEIKQLKDRLQAEADYLQAEIKVNHRYGDIVGEGAVIRQVLNRIEQVSPTLSSVLIYGETGTGKEVIARAIHQLSLRKSRMMVKVNCASLPASLIESELFGREKGAYTGAMTRQIGRFEVADGSTLFLDEVGELSLELQSKLLRVLQEGEFERLGSPKTIKVDVRLITATNRDLAEEVNNGRFREDLFYRLNVFPIKVPPLRERSEDIPSLVWTFINEFSDKMGKKIQLVPKKAMEALQHYHWPGNVRQLRNVIEHAMIISTGNTLNLQLPESPASLKPEAIRLEEVEIKHITQVLEKTNWRIKGRDGAAELLGLNPGTLYSKMKKLGIPNRRERN